ncbi:Ldh family oxidoreductase [Sporolactobacillus shoreicorticis]|uniref:Ldh family oxidoreductase n=1 Tax=Sporolactobacillus shoreicorticis TaxID=1923877 RepID=A0ABW5RZZ1_9BACL|nr:Ldh family oxidoreductase [Sporolactobacillus shoreicorticis]MCO7124728.1 Ldh family oxidoreductase [Sporolactobacillus shoreicorticis]
MVVELLTEILAQGSIFVDTSVGNHDFSQFLLTIDPSFFGDLDALRDNAASMFNRTRNLEYLQYTESKILGDYEYKHYIENRQNEVSVDDKIVEDLKRIGQE